MGFVEWGALGIFSTFMVGFGGFLFRVADRLNKAEARANEAAKVADDAKTRVDHLETELVNHRVAVATEYVSRKTLEILEGKLVEAINRLGDRLDKLFHTPQA
jgi:NACalpha-BTF3-like transcription factor